MIKILDEFIADKIAAGEVIERPLSIVKELIENSIDAGSKSIIVEIKNGGKSYIRVTDDGCGIDSSEVELAFLRHSTSKINSIIDLDRITTLGFRGEALASISAISRLTIVTKTAASDTATKLILHAGKVISQSSVGANKGTTIIVEDVFYNTPARRKFMGTDGREASAIIELIQQFAIYYSDIRFMIINNGKTILSTTGDNDTLSTIQTIYPSKEYSHLLQVKSDFVNGFISDPGTTKSNRSGQLFFVNGRLVQSNIIENAVKKGYGDRLFSGYPISILFMNVPYENCDVNIHPSKKEIKFLYEHDISSHITEAIKQSLSGRLSVPRTSVSDSFSGYSNHEDKFADKNSYNFSMVETASNIAEEFKDYITSDSDSDIDYDYNSNSDTENDIDNNNSNNISAKNENTSQLGIKDFLRDIAKQKESNTNLKFNLEDPATDVDDRLDFSALLLRGYIFNAYIIMEYENEIFLFDQHAAHERIFYEKFRTNYENKNNIPQPILTPFTFSVSADIYTADRIWLNHLAEIGYDISDFGPNTFIIRGIPEYMNLEEADLFARSYFDMIDDNNYISNQIVLDKIIMKSCKSAVKANEKLSEHEIHDLIKALSKCKNPYSCPHGRPTFIKIRKYDVERAFKRK